MKLHYSQTTKINNETAALVSVPYEITLLSNQLNTWISSLVVSVPYEITLLSNAFRSVKK